MKMSKYKNYWDNFNVELYEKFKKIKMSTIDEEYYNMSNEETLERFRLVLQDDFDGDAIAMIADIEQQAAYAEDYDTAVAMRDLNIKLKKDKETSNE
jgi:hypothetical protein